MKSSAKRILWTITILVMAGNPIFAGAAPESEAMKQFEWLKQLEDLGEQIQAIRIDSYTSAWENHPDEETVEQATQHLEVMGHCTVTLTRTITGDNIYRAGDGHTTITRVSTFSVGVMQVADLEKSPLEYTQWPFIFRRKTPTHRLWLETFDNQDRVEWKETVLFENNPSKTKIGNVSATALYIQDEQMAHRIQDSWETAIRLCRELAP